MKRCKTHFLNQRDIDSQLRAPDTDEFIYGPEIDLDVIIVL